MAEVQKNKHLFISIIFHFFIQFVRCLVNMSVVRSPLRWQNYRCWWLASLLTVDHSRWVKHDNLRTAHGVFHRRRLRTRGTVALWVVAVVMILLDITVFDHSQRFSHIEPSDRSVQVDIDKSLCLGIREGRACPCWEMKHSTSNDWRRSVVAFRWPKQTFCSLFLFLLLYRGYMNRIDWRLHGWEFSAHNVKC